MTKLKKCPKCGCAVFGGPAYQKSPGYMDDRIGSVGSWDECLGYWCKKCGYKYVTPTLDRKDRNDKEKTNKKATGCYNEKRKGC